MSTQVTVHREQRFTNCFNVHDAGNEMGLLIKNIESVYGQQISLDEQVLPCKPPSYASQGPSRHILILRPLHPQSKKSDREKAVVEDKWKRSTERIPCLRTPQRKSHPSWRSSRPGLLFEPTTRPTPCAYLPSACCHFSRSHVLCVFALSASVGIATSCANLIERFGDRYTSGQHQQLLSCFVRPSYIPPAGLRQHVTFDYIRRPRSTMSQAQPAAELGGRNHCSVPS